jgi:hypothetical protein
MVDPETIAVCFEQTGVSYRTREESDPMETVTSSDGTTIAFDRLGDGPPVIVVGGQLCDRALTRPTAKELAKRFTVFNYDRRGRGDSGDTAPYALEREVEDIGGEKQGPRWALGLIQAVGYLLFLGGSFSCSDCWSAPSGPDRGKPDRPVA